MNFANETEWILAPMDGVTDYPYRNAWMEVFGAAPTERRPAMRKAVSPFITLVQGEKIKPGHLADILPENNLMEIEPQILGKEADCFLVMARALADLGYTSVNWNLGCPMRQVASKQRGCGLLPHPDLIDDFLNRTLPFSPLGISVKIRLGYHSSDEIYKVAEVLNRYPLLYVAVHPRIGKQLYGGEADRDKFEEVLGLLKAPCIYSGDINSPEKARTFLNRFGGRVKGVMLGRGVIENPFLPGLISGIDYSEEEMKELFAEFVRVLWRNYKNSPLSEFSALQRQKLYWSKFRGSFVPEGGFDRIKRLTEPAAYEKLI